MYALCLVSACDNDVFIDRADAPKDMAAKIEGDGGDVTFSIPTAGLMHIGFGGISVLAKYVTYYNAEGGIIDPDSPAADIGSIVYHSDFSKFEIHKNDNELTIRSVYNALQRDVQWPVWLEYGYGIWHIDVTTTPGRPFRLVSVDYPEGFMANDAFKISTSSLRVKNSGPLPSAVELRPYLNELANILVVPADNNNWIKGDTFYIRVPVYENRQWILKEKRIVPDVKYTYADYYRMKKEEVIIPANSEVNVVTKMKYAGVVAEGIMHFLNEIADLDIYVPISVTSLYPVSYEISIEDTE